MAFYELRAGDLSPQLLQTHDDQPSAGHQAALHGPHCVLWGARLPIDSERDGWRLGRDAHALRPDPPHPPHGLLQMLRVERPGELAEHHHVAARRRMLDHGVVVGGGDPVFDTGAAGNARRRRDGRQCRGDSERPPLYHAR